MARVKVAKDSPADADVETGDGQEPQSNFRIVPPVAEDDLDPDPQTVIPGMEDNEKNTQIERLAKLVADAERDEDTAKSRLKDAKGIHNLRKIELMQGMAENQLDFYKRGKIKVRMTKGEPDVSVEIE